MFFKKATNREPARRCSFFSFHIQALATLFIVLPIQNLPSSLFNIEPYPLPCSTLNPSMFDNPTMYPSLFFFHWTPRHRRTSQLELRLNQGVAVREERHWTHCEEIRLVIGYASFSQNKVVVVLNRGRGSI